LLRAIGTGGAFFVEPIVEFRLRLLSDRNGDGGLGVELVEKYVDKWFGGGLMLGSGEGGSVASVSEPELVENGEEGNFEDVGDDDADEDIELADWDVRSDGEVYEIMFVVEMSATGADICVFERELRFELDSSDDKEENPSP